MLSRTTNSAKTYVERWQSHMRELQSVFLEAKLPYGEWEVELEHFNNIIDKAANNLVADGHLEDDREDT